jgi:glycosyltransferase involved in cell wall biosynthesis
VNSVVTTYTSGSGPDTSCGPDLDCMPDDNFAALSKDPLVSVIVPCYNGAPFLEEALRSALSQTYPEVEIIVVDDGSTDQSPEIAQRFPVRYIRQENRGLTPTRNLGVRESRGTYIVFLDADDRLKPEAIETGVRMLEHRPECAMAVGDHHFIAADGSYLAESRKDCLPAYHYEALLKSNFIEMISSVLFRRSIFEQVGGFDTNLRVAEDYELYLRIARAHPICCHPAIVAEYRIHDTNASRNSELMLTMTLRVLKSQARYVRYNVRRLIAFHEGFRCWRKQYGRQLASELARSISTLRGEDRVRKLLLLANHYPQGLLMLVLLKVVPSLGMRKTMASFGQPIHSAASNSFEGRRQQASITNVVTVHRGPIMGKVSASRQKESASL